MTHRQKQKIKNKIIQEETIKKYNLYQLNQCEELSFLKDYYYCTNDGKLFSFSRSPINNVYKPIIPQIDKDGYMAYNVTTKHNKKIRLFAHRMVAFIFVKNDNKDEKNQVNHIDENKLNNHYTNLEWCTIQYNLSYGNRVKKGSEKRRKKIAQKTKEGNVVHIYNSIMEAKKYGFLNNKISEVINGHKKYYKGYIWEEIK